MTHVPDSHPRALSLRLRERLVQGLRLGITSEAGLIAHGRGEALDYLLGERTHDFAEQAIGVAAAFILLATHPVVSVNGNVAALAADALVALVERCPAIRLEVNLFHASDERERRIASHLARHGASNVLHPSEHPWEPLPRLEHNRQKMCRDGIAAADVVLVPLEDGDRCGALVASGRRVITIDLNPLSRTAQRAHVTIVDELTRALPRLHTQLASDQATARESLAERIERYDNALQLRRAVAVLRAGVSPS
ncbi:phosphopantothenate/pantothenate synthetase [Sorangium sp. So ce381]|uniref:phosphopantothenate/pantothenate synthetase n=1 Tax=Sorangium sp. So ce381 TaxID=3133307 RepID=UPI003F5AF648